MQLDPYEQQLDLPARARQVGGRDGGNLAVIGQAIERCSRFDVAELDAPHGMRIVDGRGPAGPLDGWVAGQPEDLATGRAQRRWNCGLDSARMTKKAVSTSKADRRLSSAQPWRMTYGAPARESADARRSRRAACRPRCA